MSSQTVSHSPLVDPSLGQPMSSQTVSHSPLVESLGQPMSAQTVSHSPLVDPSLGQPMSAQTVSHSPLVDPSLGQLMSSHIESHSPLVESVGQPMSSQTESHSALIKTLASKLKTSQLGRRNPVDQTLLVELMDSLRESHSPLVPTSSGQLMSSRNESRSQLVQSLGQPMSSPRESPTLHLPTLTDPPTPHNTSSSLQSPNPLPPSPINPPTNIMHQEQMAHSDLAIPLTSLNIQSSTSVQSLPNNLSGNTNTHQSPPTVSHVLQDDNDHLQTQMPIEPVSKILFIIPPTHTISRKRRNTESPVRSLSDSPTTEDYVICRKRLSLHSPLPSSSFMFNAPEEPDIPTSPSPVPINYSMTSPQDLNSSILSQLECSVESIPTVAANDTSESQDSQSPTVIDYSCTFAPVPSPSVPLITPTAPSPRQNSSSPKATDQSTSSQSQFSVTPVTMSSINSNPSVPLNATCSHPQPSKTPLPSSSSPPQTLNDPIPQPTLNSSSPIPPKRPTSAPPLLTFNNTVNPPLPPDDNVYLSQSPVNPELLATVPLISPTDTLPVDPQYPVLHIPSPTHSELTDDIVSEFDSQCSQMTAGENVLEQPHAPTIPLRVPTTTPDDTTPQLRNENPVPNSPIIVPIRPKHPGPLPRKWRSDYTHVRSNDNVPPRPDCQISVPQSSSTGSPETVTPQIQNNEDGSQYIVFSTPQSPDSPQPETSIPLVIVPYEFPSISLRTSPASTGRASAPPVEEWDVAPSVNSPSPRDVISIDSLLSSSSDTVSSQRRESNSSISDDSDSSAPQSPSSPLPHSERESLSSASQSPTPLPPNNMSPHRSRSDSSESEHQDLTSSDDDVASGNISSPEPPSPTPSSPTASHPVPLSSHSSSSNSSPSPPPSSIPLSPVPLSSTSSSSNPSPSPSTLPAPIPSPAPPVPPSSTPSSLNPSPSIPLSLIPLPPVPLSSAPLPPYPPPPPPPSTPSSSNPRPPVLLSSAPLPPYPPPSTPHQIPGHIYHPLSPNPSPDSHATHSSILYSCITKYFSTNFSDCVRRQ
ncbi:mucin-5AC-like [Spodoptera frugiperda]|uniref:Mucin-5AC-like n=1 Tax=Spodoptera frugiperda TaxID=7108 RepID=A0A9R0EZZ0_SPOFR|nr:mucin-5AC-like [Spodoptera frugiperda]